MISPQLFSTLLLRWFKKNGRTKLPWQHPRTPYRVWVSEIMLQQTQVTTVIPYFGRFIHQFPTLKILAHADQDTVLHVWAGLGYYARARYLHQAAKKVVQEFKNQLPNDIKSLQSLPGIGRSTAGAILSLGFNQPAPILDGNVKRLFCRLHAIEGWSGENLVNRRLWQLAEQYVSQDHPCDYTQALMDLGALVCTKKTPDCLNCPFIAHCLAYQRDQIDQYPNTKPRDALITRQSNFLVLINSKQEIFLEKRPPIGIWGGLWSVPECKKVTSLLNWCEKNYGCTVDSLETYLPIKHTFSHFHLEIHPIIVRVRTVHHALEDHTNQGWFNKREWNRKGLAAPVKKLLQNIFERAIDAT